MTSNQVPKQREWMFHGVIDCRTTSQLKNKLSLAVMTRRVLDAADGWLAVECGMAPVVVVGVEEVRQGFGAFGMAGVRAHVRPFVEQGAIYTVSYVVSLRSRL